jgi:O-antigen/teichoic acid export membrane protein
VEGRVEEPAGAGADPTPRHRRAVGAALALPRRAARDSLLRNSGFMIATTVATSALGYAYWIIVAHLYPVDSVGLAAALLSAASLASLLSTLGVHFGLIHLLPRRADDRHWSLTVNTALLVTTAAGGLAGLVCVGLVLPLSAVLRAASTDWLFAVLFVGQAALGTTASTLDYVSVAERAAHGMFLRNVVSSLLRIALVTVPVLVHAGARGILASWFVGNVVIIVASLLVLRTRRRGYRFVLRGWRAEMRGMVAALWHHAINLGNMAPVLLLPVVAATRLSSADAAYLYTTWKVGGLFFMVSPAVASSLFAEGSHSRAGLERRVRSSAVATAALLLPLMAFFLLAGRPVLRLFGDDYAAGGAALLTLLVASAIPDAVTNLYVTVLRIQGRLRTAAALNCAMAVVALALGWLLLAPLGLPGAAAAWIVAQSAGCLFVLVDARRRRGAASTGAPPCA